MAAPSARGRWGSGRNLVCGGTIGKSALGIWEEFQSVCGGTIGKGAFGIWEENEFQLVCGGTIGAGALGI